MKKRKIVKRLMAILTIACMCVLPMTSLKANATYEIVFKAGLHGTINNEKKISYRLEYGSVFPDEPTVQVEDGYVFKGWNKALPAVGSSVEGKAVYVAQYDVLVSGINYLVKYVNEENVMIATSKASMAEEDSLIKERAKTIPGYTYQEAEKSMKIDAENKVIVFTYTLSNPDQIVRNEEEVINELETITTTNTNQNNTNPLENGNQTEENVTENDTLKTEGNEENVNDNKTPKAEGITSKNNTMMYVGVAGCLLFILAGVTFYYVSKKKNEHKV